MVLYTMNAAGRRHFRIPENLVLTLLLRSSDDQLWLNHLCANRKSWTVWRKSARAWRNTFLRTFNVFLRCLIPWTWTYTDTDHQHRHTAHRKRMYTQYTGAKRQRLARMSPNVRFFLQFGVYACAIVLCWRFSLFALCMSVCGRAYTHTQTFRQTHTHTHSHALNQIQIYAVVVLHAVAVLTGPGPNKINKMKNTLWKNILCHTDAQPSGTNREASVCYYINLSLIFGGRWPARMTLYTWSSRNIINIYKSMVYFVYITIKIVRVLSIN